MGKVTARIKVQNWADIEMVAVGNRTEIPRAALPASLLPRYPKEADSQFAKIERGRDLETGAEGATAPETLRQKDRIDTPNHLESGF